MMSDHPRPPAPNHIPLPPPPTFSSFGLVATPDDGASPYLQFHTAPSSPFSELASPHSPGLAFYTPPTSPRADQPAPARSITPPVLQITIPQGPPLQPIPGPTDDPFPTADIPIDLALDDEGLSTLEKIYLFSRSKAIFHRVFIAHALPSFLEQVSPQEAIEYVLPLLSGLAMDEDEQVKEALAAELVPVIWWFFTRCQIIPDDLRTEETIYPSLTCTTTISVQAFTPILGTLLLSSNPLVGGAARYAVVDLLSRMNKADLHEFQGSPTSILALSPETEEDEVDNWMIGLFLREEREMFRNEILQQVVIGMGRLDVEPDEKYDGITEDLPDQWHESNSERSVGVVTPGEQGNGEDGVSSPHEQERERSEGVKVKSDVNPYFPVLASPFSVPSPSSSAGSTPSSTGTTGSLSSSSSSPGATYVISSSKRSSSELDDIDSTGKINVTPPISSLHTSSNTPVDDQSSSDLLPDDWIPSAPRPSHATLPLPSQLPSQERWPSADLPGGAPDLLAERRHYSIGDFGSHSSYSVLGENGYFEDGSEDDEQDEQAAVGRLSSMSLMAAVTASGPLAEETKEAFVKEVERVGRDPVYWVRREASFALGALAKVVPEEVVICTLIPLFDTLRKDNVWHVRHSALFALPAILSRLSPHQRQSLALDTILTLSTDDSATVRSGVLEALGEVLYTFHADEGGPPKKLLHLFLGRKEDRRVRDGQQALSIQRSPHRTHRRSATKENPLESFYTDPERPLVCAFNYPAVALTLGRGRWVELRDVYLDISANRATKVRRTLAASLGQLAKIIGEEHAQHDLMDIWWDSIRCEEEEVREKAVECISLFIQNLGTVAGASIIQGLVTVWDEGTLKGWREREGIMGALVNLITLNNSKSALGISELLRRGLQDNVAAVRGRAVSVLPLIWTELSSRWPSVQLQLEAELQLLAHSSLHRRRMTFVACQEALITQNPNMFLDEHFWLSLSILADDPIIGVRIGIARLLSFVSGTLLSKSQPIPAPLHNLVLRLSHDSSHEVQSYVPGPFIARRHDKEPLPPTNPNANNRHVTNISTFSRPPRTSLHWSPTHQLFTKVQGSWDHPTADNDLPHAERTFTGSRSSDMTDVDRTDVPQVLGQFPSFRTNRSPVSEITPTIGPRSLISLPIESHDGAEGAFNISSHDMDANSNTSILSVPAG
ncbi:armadillo-type protein [Collybia nuda]|uniref:Armadillo-type protein n=1 Tax=Collybia nuda TaxID=64659 RepID=A0A9P5XTF0_9AGAR|nr:armadillo-type protein [Collybia nuda]